RRSPPSSACLSRFRSCSPWCASCCVRGGGMSIAVNAFLHDGECLLSAELTGLRTREAMAKDAAAIAEIYNQGIADRMATFETRPSTAAQITEWFTRALVIIVVESEMAGPVAFAAAFPYSDRACYAG